MHLKSDENGTWVTYNHWAFGLPGQWIELTGDATTAKTIDLKKRHGESAITIVTGSYPDGEPSPEEMNKRNRTSIAGFYNEFNATYKNVEWSPVAVCNDPKLGANVIRHVLFENKAAGKSGFYLVASWKHKMMKCVGTIDEGFAFAAECRDLIVRTLSLD